MKNNGYDFLVTLSKAKTKESPQPSPYDKITITERLPRVDKAINAAGDALWDAWLIGLEQSGYKVDRNVSEPEREPMEPEM